MRAGPTASGLRPRPGVATTVAVESRPGDHERDGVRTGPNPSSRTATVIELNERRSAPVRTAVAMVVVFCGLALLSTLRFPRPVLWPILGAVAIYLLLFVALSAAFLSRPRTRERIEIDGPRLTVESSRGRTVVRRDWRTPWTVLDAYDDGEDDVRLWLVSGDQRVAIGRHVGVQARRDAVASLEAHLSRGG
ncbi:MAG: hypothetical protein B7Z42_08430 [Brevundimonas sp. 12-68-7]|uniref:DUF2244 domain-containing protein n=1 Tax=Brevundimonas subvibrioides TaxID=74313 RepID=A0A258FKX8_9CAUL|nr:MAG: hypothetical protein B7Z42_08430 [Brevundimonas sp. 12-68-7]OYX32624.1 MAG: hypothetical protein B7Z01_10695 [Brevundimonas subvibrioides]